MSKRSSSPRGFVPGAKHPGASSPASLIKSEGKSLSKKNAARVKSAIDGMASSIGTLKEILEDAGIIGEGGDDETQAGAVSLSAFTDFVDSTSWYQKLDNILYMFSWFFQDLVYDSVQEGDEGSEEAQAQINQLISELSNYLMDLANTYPAMQASGLTLASLLQAGVSQEEVERSLIQIEVPAGNFDFLEAGSAANKYPIEGKLFTVDCLSEGIPAVGPGKKLMIPRAVAEAAVNQVIGLPLDAADDLSHHSNEDIVGVMLGALIKPDNGFWVRANLFPFNQPDKVAQIKANKDQLGFSINAYAPGHDEVIDGETAHVIDSLVLLGANILYKTSATFQDTALVARGKAPSRRSDRAVEIAAASRNAAQAADSLNQTTNEDGDGMNPELEARFKLLEQGQQAMTQSQLDLAAALQGIQAAIQPLVTAEQQRTAAAEQQAQLSQQQQQQQEMQATIRQMLRQEVGKVVSVNGSPSAPARITNGLLAAETDTVVASDPSIQIRLQLAQLRGQLEEVERTPGRGAAAMTRRLELTDKIRALEHQLPTALQPA